MQLPLKIIFTDLGESETIRKNPGRSRRNIDKESQAISKNQRKYSLEILENLKERMNSKAPRIPRRVWN